MVKLGFKGLAVATFTLQTAAVPHCPDYTSYSQVPHEPASTGPLGLPYMRPAPACRTFNSTVVEGIIEDMKSLIRDPDVARLFENTFPNTLDTTVKYFNATENLAFIITGDIKFVVKRRFGSDRPDA